MPTEPSTPESAGKLAKFEQGGTLLIAEDEESLRSLISEKMKAVGYQVLEAANGEEAVALASRHQGPIDFLVTDVIPRSHPAAERERP